MQINDNNNNNIIKGDLRTTCRKASGHRIFGKTVLDGQFIIFKTSEGGHKALCKYSNRFTPTFFYFSTEIGAKK